MAKNKKRRVDTKSSRPSHPTTKNSAHRVAKPTTKPAPHQPQPKRHVQAHQKPTVPFSASDNILLVGEGDFSFTHSLLKHHRDKFASLCATCLDSREELLEKYPQAEQYITTVLLPPEITSVDVVAASGSQEEEVDYPSDDEPPSEGGNSTPKKEQHKAAPCSVLYSVDATQISKHKPIRTRKWDRIVFNFPHVGGKSTDVNRQVRYNQALLHSFFQVAKPLLSKPNGTILVTIFEGAPYDLWNIRDLARSAELVVLRSSAFDAGLYPGYAHARTVGNIRGKERRKAIGDGEGNGEGGEDGDAARQDQEDGQDGDAETPQKTRPGKWRGEERKARTYEFGLPEEVRRRGAGVKKRKRHEKGKDSDSSGEGDN